MFGLNPVATGILIGGIGGPMGMAIGGGIGAMYDNAQGMKRDAEKAQRKLETKAVENQNALVNETFQKRKAAFGIGEALAGNAKETASASGMFSSEGGSKNSILG